jgi:transposase
MRIMGCDLHSRQQTLAMLDTATGVVVKKTLKHEDDNVREFYSTLPRPVRVGIEATGSMQWFVNLMEELGIECLVGHPAEIRAAEPDSKTLAKLNAAHPASGPLAHISTHLAGIRHSCLHAPIERQEDLRDRRS